MKSFQDLVYPGHYKVTMGHRLLLRSPQGSLKALGITYYLHRVWRPQSSGKVEKANQFFKIINKKHNPGDLPGMEGGFTKSSLQHHIAPKEQVGLRPYEMLYGKTFVYVNDLFLYPEAQTPLVLYHSLWAIPTG